MRTREIRWLFPLALIAAVGGCSGMSQKTQSSAASAPDPGVAMAAVDSMNKLYLTAVAARDSNTIMTMYTEDAYQNVQTYVGGLGTYF